MHNSNQKKPYEYILNKLGLVFVFFPSVIFFITGTHTQPLSGIFFSAQFLSRIKKIYFPNFFILLLVIIYLISIPTSIIFASAKPFLVLVHGFSLILPIIAYLALREAISKHLSHKLVSNILSIWVLFGLYQWIGGIPVLDKLIEPIIRNLVHADIVFGQYSWARGYSLLAYEPSMSAPTIISFIISLIYLNPLVNRSKTGIIFDVFRILILILLNQTGTLYAIICVFGLGWLFGVLIKSPKKIGYILLVLLTLTFLILINPPERVMQIIIQITGYLNGNQNFLETLAMVGGQRIFPLTYGYAGIFEFSGVASWTVEGYLDRRIQLSGLNVYDYSWILGETETASQMKPQSFVSLVVSDIGILGLSPILLFTVLSTIDLCRSKDNSGIPLACAAATFFYIYFLPLAPLVAPWLWLSIGQQYIKNNKS